MNTPQIDLIVTRHPSLVALMVERGIVDESTRVIEHATGRDVNGKHVLGILPHHLSSQAASITEIPIRFADAAERGAFAARDIPLDRLREMAGRPVTYIVQAASHSVALGQVFARVMKSTSRPCDTYMDRGGIMVILDECESLIGQIDVGSSQPSYRIGSNMPHVEGKPWCDEYGAELPSKATHNGRGTCECVHWAQPLDTSNMIEFRAGRAELDHAPLCDGHGKPEGPS